MSEINYLEILEYLKNNRGIAYKKPDNDVMTKEDIDKYNTLKKNAVDIVDKLKKIHSICSEKYRLLNCGKVSWLDGSNTKTRKYLWLPMKYSDYSDLNVSISLFAEMLTDEIPVYRISLELQNNKSDDEDFKNYHRHLELPIYKDSGLVYVWGSTEKGTPKILNETQEEIKLKIENKEYDKVQICKYIDTENYPTNEAIEKGILESVEALIPYYEYVIGQKEKQVNMNSKISTVKHDKNIILYGPPGTGKTYNTVNYAVSICDNEPLEEVKKKSYDEVIKRYNELKEEGRVFFTTFHQSYGYEEFIEGISPIISNEDSETSNNKGNIEYKIKSGLFKSFCENAEKFNNDSSKKNLKPCVFIIDEINRGNISKIFGELITLIEDTKRKGELEEVSVSLPYSGKNFSVPSNVHILGTMNTADRSIALMDTALRRRFSFIEVMPDTQVLKDISADKVEDLNLVAMLNKINERIELLYDREHTIGHAFFTNLRGENANINNLAKIFRKSVIPLLQEYFYDDYEKIQIILGDNDKSTNNKKFIIDSDLKLKTVFKGSVDDILDIPEKKYHINEDAFFNIDSYKEII